MKVLGIGNAIVDVICKVEEDFITQNNLAKSTMKLFFNESEFKNLLVNLKIEKTVSGGSVANSIVGISQLGDKTGFIGKISDDDYQGYWSDYRHVRIDDVSRIAEQDAKSLFKILHNSRQMYYHEELETIIENAEEEA